MKTDNRSQGNRFEQALAIILGNNGFWVHLLQQSKAGQPADIIAIKGHYHTLIDCKVISDEKGFPFKRIEENQRYAMSSFTRKSHENCWFAMKLPDGAVHMISLTHLLKLAEHGQKRMTESQIRAGWTLDDWLKNTNVWSEDS